MSVGKNNETFLIRVWKSLSSRHVLKNFKEKKIISADGVFHLLQNFRLRARPFSKTF